MDFDVDGGTLLYGLGLVLALAALVYFVRDLVFGLSITVKAVLLLLAFVSFLAVGTAVDRDGVDLVALALAGGAYVVFLAYVTSNYALGETGTFLLLTVSAALFVGLGFVVRERNPDLSLRTAGYVLAGVIVVSLVLVGADAAGGGVTYAVETNETVTVDPPGERVEPGHDAVRRDVRVGTLTATNDFVFTRRLDPPETAACLVTPDGVRDRSHSVDYRYPEDSDVYPRTIGGGERVRIAMSVHVPVDANRTTPITYAVERADNCPASADEPTVVVGVGADRDAFHPRPV